MLLYNVLSLRDCAVPFEPSFGMHSPNSKTRHCFWTQRRTQKPPAVGNEPQFVKTYASPSQTKSRNRRSKFVVCTIVRCSEFSSCCLRDRCSFLTENLLALAFIYAVSSYSLRANQPVTDNSNVNSSA